MNTLEKEGTTVGESELLVHEFNPEGVCLEPERIIVPVPKGCTCELRLAHGKYGSGWHVGYHLAAGKEGSLNTYPAIAAPDWYADRTAALGAALKAAADFFEASPKSKLHRKCAGEVHAFAIRLGGSPANTSSSGELRTKVPLPVPEQLEVAVARLEENPHNPRGTIDLKSEDIAALADTIAAVGLLQPVGVRRLPYDDSLPGMAGDSRLQLLWGHRRAAAFRKLKRETIPARVYDNITDEQARLLLLIENGQQKQLDPIQEARGFQEMARDFGMSQEDVAQAVKKSRPVVANAMRLLELPEEVQELLTSGQLTIGHGTALCRFKAWPKVCAKIAQLAVREKSSANSLEKNLPFGEELVEAGLAVNLEYVVRSTDKAAKKLNAEPGFFIWEDGDYYDEFAFCLDLERGRQMVKEHQEERDARNEREEQERAGRDESGEMTPAAKRERAKKLDGNLTNRLQTSAMQHAALERLKGVDSIDAPALLVVIREAFQHDACQDIEELAGQLGLKLPKNFDESDLLSIASLELPDALRLAAAALAARDTDHAMRYASEVPEFVELLVREDVNEKLDAPSYVAEWEERILPLVKYGCRADDVVERLGCPTFIAEQLVRQIRRNLRSADVPLISKADGDAMDLVTADELGKIKYGLKQGSTIGALNAQLPGVPAAVIQSVDRVLKMEAAYAKAFKTEEETPPAKTERTKTAKKSAPAKAKKGGKKK